MRLLDYIVILTFDRLGVKKKTAWEFAIAINILNRTISLITNEGGKREKEIFSVETNLIDMKLKFIWHEVFFFTFSSFSLGQVAN